MSQTVRPLPAEGDDGKWLGLSRKDGTGDPDRYMREDKLPRKATKSRSTYQPTPGEKVRRPQNGEKGPRGAPEGGKADPDYGGGAKQPTHIRNPSVNRQ